MNKIRRSTRIRRRIVLCAHSFQNTTFVVMHARSDARVRLIAYLTTHCLLMYANS